MADTKSIFEQAYSAFNKRDVDGALALMVEDVSTNSSKSLQGNVLSDSQVFHVFTMSGGLIAAMDLADDDDATVGPSAAFAHRP